MHKAIVGICLIFTAIIPTQSTQMHFEQVNGKNVLVFDESQKAAPKKRNLDDGFFKVKKPKQKREAKPRKLPLGALKKMVTGNNDEEKLKVEIENIKARIVNLNVEQMVTENTKTTLSDLNGEMIKLTSQLKNMSEDLVRMIDDKIDDLKNLSSSKPSQD